MRYGQTLLENRKVLGTLPCAASLSESFSTERVPARDRLDAWQLYAKLVCGNSRFDFPRRSAFRGEIGRRRLGMLQLSHFSCTPVSFAKYPDVSTKSEDPGCVIISQLSGDQNYRQNGRSVVLQPGDTTLIDAGRPWSSTCATNGSRLYLRLPRWFVQEKLSVSALPVLPRISGASLAGASLFRLGTSLYHEAGALPSGEGLAVSIDSYLLVLSSCIGAQEHDEPARGPELDARIDRFIDEHIADPELKPLQIAIFAGISVRHLHRLFLRKRMTVTECIRSKRLENCRAELSDPRCMDRSITEVAFSWGFSDSAHFSHCFKRRFGISAREFRLRRFNASVGDDELEIPHWEPKDRAERPN